MNVRLAAQVLSSTVSKILCEYYDSSTHETANYCLLMNKFFDIMNIRNQLECTKKRNEFLKPIKEVNDTRVIWLKDVFFIDWKKSINDRSGFSKSEKDKMFISKQTFEGLQITTYSTIEASQFLLQNGLKFVLTEKFNQDCLEEYFGYHRCLGRQSDNPTIFQFGYNANTLRMQRTFAIPTGNTEGKYRQKRNKSWHAIDNNYLKKRKHDF